MFCREHQNWAHDGSCFRCTIATKDARIAELKSALAKAEEAVLKADNELAWATCMMAEGVEFYTLREVFHAAQKDAMKAHQTLKDALAAIKEMKP